MDFGLIFIPILYTDFWPKFNSNTIDYDFWTNCHSNTIDYGFWPYFHPMHSDFGRNFRHNTID